VNGDEDMFQVDDNVYAEIFHLSESRVYRDMKQDRWIIYVNTKDNIEKKIEEGLGFILSRRP